jgi:NTE family protein
VSSGFPEPVWTPGGHMHRWLNSLAATQALFFGVSGFFTPRLPPAPLQPRGALGDISFYDTTPLKETLERLIDFERLNSGELRVAVGAVNVGTGNMTFFDSARQRLDVRHIMASGALPPGFPPVEIDGEFYWDGGLASNTPLEYLLDQSGNGHRTVFQVDLFPARGRFPATMERVAEREKDIRYSSRTRLNTDMDIRRRRVAAAAMRLMDKLPTELREDPDACEVKDALQAHAASLDIVHLIYRAKRYESDTKDYEFSRLTMREHWATGRADVLQTLRDPRWTGRGPADAYGVRVFDLVSTERTAATTSNGVLEHEPA